MQRHKRRKAHILEDSLMEHFHLWSERFTAYEQAADAIYSYTVFGMQAQDSVDIMRVPRRDEGCKVCLHTTVNNCRALWGTLRVCKL